MLAAVSLLPSGGCVQRIISVQSNPTGAVVYLNDQEVGRTPVQREFTWYGDYDVVLRKEGYETLKTHAPVPAPWWQFIPLDLFTEALPLTDTHSFRFDMHLLQPEDPLHVLDRGEQLQAMLESSPIKKPPAAHAATRPSH